MNSEIETLATPAKAGKKRFNVKDVCAFYGVSYEKAEKLPWSDRNELINRHYDAQALLRKASQVKKLMAQVDGIEEEIQPLQASKARLDELLNTIK